MRIVGWRCYKLSLHLNCKILHTFKKLFQQDGTTSYTARQSMEAVRELFGNRVTSRSPDLSVCYFFLWGYVKSKVYTIRPRTLDKFKQRIQDKIHCIPAEMLKRSMRNLNSRFQECICTGGRHFKKIL